MKILLLGSTGQVGWELNRTFLTLGELVALDYPQIDMADPDSIRLVVQEVKPNLIVNATAYTNVDKAEIEPELAMAINGTGPGILAQEAKKLGAGLLHYSTDYVFDGTKGSSYTEEDQPNPINVYGETKLAGEEAVQIVGGTYLIFRTSWVYSLRRPCFVTKVLEWARKNDALSIVDDQISNPTWARMLAEVTSQIIAQGQAQPEDYIKEKTGLYHLTSGNSCNRYEWAKEILALDPMASEQLAHEIQPAKTIDFPTPAVRPLYSVLNCRKYQECFNIPLIGWEKSLSLALDV